MSNHPATLHSGYVVIERRQTPPARGQGDQPYVQDPAHPKALMPAELLERLTGRSLPHGTRLHITIMAAGATTEPPVQPDGTPLEWTPLT